MKDEWLSLQDPGEEIQVGKHVLAEVRGDLDRPYLRDFQ
jgi:hypothetical protein